MKRYLLTLTAIALALGSAQAKKYADIKGRVTDTAGKPIAGAVVSNGIDCTATAADGTYSFDGTRDVRHVFVSTPSGWLPEMKDVTIPVYYIAYNEDAPAASYDFKLRRNPVDDTHHTVFAQADAQVTSESDLRKLIPMMADMDEYASVNCAGRDVFAVDLGDIVGDSPWLYPASVEVNKGFKRPIYRVIGNHDMTYGGRTFEKSFTNFENQFGPVCYSFNKGKAHYIVLDNCFYVNRDYQYIGYIDERTFRWLEQDLSYVPEDNVIFVMMHIPTSSTPKLKYNTLIQDETVNARSLYKMLEGRNAHILSGHTHYNQNVVFSDSLMEHNTAAACGIWWKAPICSDGTPMGYGVYDVDGTDVNWLYKSAGQPDTYQMRVYPAGADKDAPADIIANVWNYDSTWKVEWLENGKVMGEMTRYDGYDPLALDICADRERVVYEWVYPNKTDHLFRCTPKDPTARVSVRATDRNGRVYFGDAPAKSVTEQPEKPKLMWIDGTGNFARFSNPDSIDYYVDKIAKLGFTHAVVDVRPISGEVLYDSKIAPRMREWNGHQRPDFDFLGHWIKKGHEAGIKVMAPMNVFCAGHNYVDRGIVYTEHPEWASVVLNPERGLIPITEEKEKYGGMTNPVNPEYQKYIIGIMTELVTLYPELDGLMLDRVRFDGISADFSDLSRRAFEKHIGKKVKKFPSDILSWKKKGDRYEPVDGKLAKQWYEWRSGVIRDFMADARRAVKTANPKVEFNTYTGAWYPSYYEVGVNFASPEYDPARDYKWATPNYKDTGYADLIDMYVTGNYYTVITADEYGKEGRAVLNETDSRPQEGLWYCVEGSCSNLRKIMKNNKFIGGILVDQFYDNPSKLSQTIAQNLKDSDGLMVFDIVHIIDKGLWDEVEKGLNQ